MAVREIRTMGDEVLAKACKEVTTMTLRTRLLIEDMIDTMYEIPSDNEIEKVIVDEKVVNGLQKPQIVRKQIA